VEKNQSELCLEVLGRFHRAGILDDIILIGSWCVYFYKNQFSYIDTSALKTRDIDFLIEYPGKIRTKVNVPDLLKDLGFVTAFKGSEGYIKLDHPDLIIEFLVPERGRGTNKPCNLPQLGINAVTLRFLNFLTDNTIKVRIGDFHITMPHPVNFALHKLIISQRRKTKEKSVKDSSAAIRILKSIIEHGNAAKIKEIYNSAPQKWQKKILNGLEQSGEKEMLEIFK